MYKRDWDLELYSLSHKYYKKLSSLTLSGNSNLMNLNWCNMLTAFWADHCDRFPSLSMNIVKQPQAFIVILQPLVTFND